VRVEERVEVRVEERVAERNGPEAIAAWPETPTEACLRIHIEAAIEGMVRVPPKGEGSEATTLSVARNITSLACHGTTLHQEGRGSHVV